VPRRATVLLESNDMQVCVAPRVLRDVQVSVTSDRDVSDIARITAAIVADRRSLMEDRRARLLRIAGRHGLLPLLAQSYDISDAQRRLGFAPVLPSSSLRQAQ